LLLRGAQPGAAPAPVAADSQQKLVSVAGAPFKGEAAAKVTIIEFTDYQCPFCGAHARDTLPLLDRDYIKTGKVKYILRDTPIESIHPLAFKAAEAAHCAGDQEKFWQMHDRMFSDQNRLGRDDLKMHAQALGLNLAEFEECLNSGKHIARIRKDIADAQRTGI